ncbi:hypothetical protein P879_10752 [Paragonimus westermani]|uniref:PDZ domain-containing protein n=1 Tax=Paragonimus westermani TaxID=34504 RepID=A0A8T0CYF0_9TREM|nr:hypothetical protein P879_10752 [Paragonimus westermani]
MEVSRHFKLRRASFGYGFSLKDEGKPFGPTAMVVKVEPGGAADRAGIRVGYQVEALGGRPVESMTYLQASNVIRASSDHLDLSVIMASDVEEASSVRSTSFLEDFKMDHPTSHSTLNDTVQACATKNSRSNTDSARFASEPRSVTANLVSGAVPFSTISTNLPTQQDLNCLPVCAEVGCCKCCTYFTSFRFILVLRSAPQLQGHRFLVKNLSVPLGSISHFARENEK